MERTVGIYEMRAKLGELVKEASEGRPIVISVRGKPVARLVAYDDTGAHEAAQWLRDVARGGKRWSVSARELVVEGRR